MQDNITLQKLNKSILVSARKAFETNGFYRTNIDDIARSLSIGKGTIYRHFGNKLMLYLSVVLYIFEESKIPIEKIKTVGSFEKKIDLFIDQAIKMMETSGNFIRVFLEEHLYLIKGPYKDKNIRKHFQYFVEAREYFILELSDILSQGIKEGKISCDLDPLLSAELAITTIISYHKIMRPSDKPGRKNNDFIESLDMRLELKKYILRSLGCNLNMNRSI